MAEVCVSSGSPEENLAENRDDIGVDTVKIASNWNINNHKCLRDAVKISSRLLPSGNDQIENIVTLDSCIQLSMPVESVDDKCTITLNCDPTSDIIIQQAVVVSEAKKIEVYIDYDEYYTTVIAEFIDKYDEDFIVYKGDISFLKPTFTCTLKFASVKKRTCFWLYGVRVSVGKKQPDVPMHGIDVSKICTRLQESDSQLTSRAEKFLHFLHKYNKAHLTKDLDPTSNQTIELPLLSSLPFVDSKCSDELSSFEQRFKNFVVQNERNTSHNGTVTERGDCNLENLKDYKHDLLSLRNQLQKDFENTLKREIQLLEERLWDKIDRRFLEFEERQNKQMTMLTQLFESINNSDRNKNSESINNNNIKVAQT